LDHQQSVDGREFNRMQNKKWEEKWTWNSRGDGVHEIREHNISHQTNH
jgi:hypothetical protein